MNYNLTEQQLGKMFTNNKYFESWASVFKCHGLKLKSITIEKIVSCGDGCCYSDEIVFEMDQYDFYGLQEIRETTPKLYWQLLSMVEVIINKLIMQD